MNERCVAHFINTAKRSLPGKMLRLPHTFNTVILNIQTLFVLTAIPKAQTSETTCHHTENSWSNLNVRSDETICPGY